MKCFKGFARIDFAVTLLCAAFLVVTMGAVGNRGRERAKQLVCASQLGKWGQAIFMHSVDNGDMVMSTVKRWGDVPFPHYMAALPDYSDPPVAYMRSDEWSVYAVNPYLGCVSENFHEDGMATRLLTCPSCDIEFMKVWTYAIWDAFCNPPGEGFIEPAYSYWGRVDRLEDNDCSPNAKDDLTGATFSGDRLLMSEILTTIDVGWWGFRYNHGVDGWSWMLGWASIPVQGKLDGEQDATGRSQLFGDGRVQWRPISLEFEDNLPSEFVEGFHENEWNGPGSGWVNPWDVSYY